MFKILISCHAQGHVVAFGDDRVMAEAELAKLVPLVGRDRWGKNGKADEPTHTIKCPTGDVTVVLEKVEVVRLLDTDADNRIYADANERNIQRDLAVMERFAAAGFVNKQIPNAD